MTRYLITPPATVTEYNAGRVQKWLNAQGNPATEVSVGTNGLGQLQYVIESTVDPTLLLQSFSPPPPPEDTARAFLRQLWPALNDGTATVAQMRNALRALIVLVMGDQDP